MSPQEHHSGSKQDLVMDNVLEGSIMQPLWGESNVAPTTPHSYPYPGAQGHIPGHPIGLVPLKHALHAWLAICRTHLTRNEGYQM